MILEIDKVRETRAQFVGMKSLMPPMEIGDDRVNRDIIKRIDFVIDLCDTVLHLDTKLGQVEARLERKLKESLG